MILETEPDLIVVAEAGDGLEALDAAATHRPDVILMDLRMPNLDGIAAIERLPADAKVLVLTTFSGDGQVYAALRAGASGYLLKTAPPEQLVTAVRTVAGGDALLDPRITRRLIQDAVSGPAPEGRRAALSALTDREIDVLVQIARGRSNAEMAAAVFLSEATVKTYLSRILTKTGTRSRTQLVVLAYETGLVRPGDAAATNRPD